MKIPKKPKVKTKWDLTKIYKSLNDPKIEKDVLKTEKNIALFEKKYKNKSHFFQTEDKLLKVLKDYEKLYDLLGKTSAPNFYLSLIELVDTSNKKAQALKTLYEERFNKAFNRIKFLSLELGRIDKKKQRKLLKNKKLADYRHLLEVFFEQGKYNLSEKEEKIISLKHIVAHDSWKRFSSMVLGELSFNHKGRKIPISAAIEISNHLKNTKERRQLFDLTMKELIDKSDIFEAEINTIYQNKKIDDELRGYKHPYSETILDYENDERVIINFVDLVTKNFKLSHRFYNLKKKYLGFRHFEYADRVVSIGEVKRKFDWKHTVDLCREVFYETHNNYGKMFDSFLRDGLIDVFPKKGKRGGACLASQSKDLPGYMLLNHVDNLRSLICVAHEMGHAIHFLRSNMNRPIYRGHTYSVAEVASTFFETLATEKVFENLSDREKVIALHDKINSDVQSIFRQIACFNFEVELHSTIRENGRATHQEIAKFMNRHMKTYLGPSFKLKDSDGYFFAYWPHIRRFFYVYSYSYAQLISKALVNNFKKDSSYIEKVDQFLSAGQSKRPEDIFKDIGVNTSKQSFFLSGLKEIEKDINEFEKLVNK
jgi:oligoendopeptidase F